MSDSGSTEGTGSESVSSARDSTEKPGGLGGDGTIPAAPDGIAIGLGDGESNFNHEEDETAITGEAGDGTDPEVMSGVS